LREQRRGDLTAARYRSSLPRGAGWRHDTPIDVITSAAEASREAQAAESRRVLRDTALP
jgi:hypothetical protein